MGTGSASCLQQVRKHQILEQIAACHVFPPERVPTEKRTERKGPLLQLWWPEIFLQRRQGELFARRRGSVARRRNEHGGRAEDPSMGHPLLGKLIGRSGAISPARTAG